ncbi:unnamed protein product [Bemisia tabaci]|uniref:Ionotropic receptor n=1 Tax=Bemisia tabaci TaxID=7038 RepID=A0A9P0F5Y0_BEMTA|nr:unnamed protein product [Bemisia tabaci]
MLLVALERVQAARNFTFSFLYNNKPLDRHKLRHDNSGFIDLETDVALRARSYEALFSEMDASKYDFSSFLGPALTNFLHEEEIFSGLKDRVVTSLNLYTEEMEEYLSWSTNTSLMVISENFTVAGAAAHDRTYGVMRQNLESILETDGMLFSVPHSVISSSTTFLMVNWMTDLRAEFHLVPEKLATFPLLYPLEKDSILSDEVSRMMSRLLEAGHVKVWIADVISELNGRFLHPEPVKVEKDSARPYGLRDMQPAFLSLLLGLALSSFVFLCELLVDFFTDSKAPRKYSAENGKKE